MVHFHKDMEAEYKDTFKQMKAKKCPQCGMALLDNYLGFIKHLAVDHEQVMKFVNTLSDNVQNKDLLIKNERGDKCDVKDIKTVNNANTPTEANKPTEEETKVPTAASKPTEVPTGLVVNESQSKSESVIPQELESVATPKKQESVAPPPANQELVPSPPPPEPELVAPPPAEQELVPSPPPPEPELVAPPEPEPEFDIRAILDSDSDLDS